MKKAPVVQEIRIRIPLGPLLEEAVEAGVWRAFDRNIFKHEDRPVTAENWEEYTWIITKEVMDAIERRVEIDW